MDCVIDFQNAVFVADGFPVIAGVDMRVMGGEVIHLRGANGAGKTSLLRALVGLIQIKSGRAIVLGHDLADDRFSVRKDVGLLGHRTFLYDDLTVLDNLRFVQKIARQPKTSLERSLDKVHITSRLLSTRVSQLSTGQRKKTALAALLIRDYKMWLLDEPHAGLDESGRILVDQLILDFQSTKGTVIIASHELDRAMSISTRSMVISGGSIPAGVTRDEAKIVLAAPVDEVDCRYDILTADTDSYPLSSNKSDRGGSVDVA
ncbi:MAG: heme ABC exporter ATP-binding protein CcmA [Firmicutes bacterium]|nr:heme ABC exporter ATP-binding protein CcmA [Bacillota bacterium]